MPPLKSRFRPDLFETRTDVWRSAGLGDELEPAEKRRWRGGLLISLLVIAASLVVYGRRSELAPGYEAWVRVGTVGVLVIAGSAAATWLGRWVSPTFYRRLDPAAAGTVGFLVRLVSLSIVVVAALRIAGVTMGTLAVGEPSQRSSSASPPSRQSATSWRGSSCREPGRSGSASG